MLGSWKDRLELASSSMIDYPLFVPPPFFSICPPLFTNYLTSPPFFHYPFPPPPFFTHHYPPSLPPLHSLPPPPFFHSSLPLQATV